MERQLNQKHLTDTEILKPCKKSSIEFNAHNFALINIYGVFI